MSKSIMLSVRFTPGEYAALVALGQRQSVPVGPSTMLAHLGRTCSSAPVDGTRRPFAVQVLADCDCDCGCDKCMIDVLPGIAGDIILQSAGYSYDGCDCDTGCECNPRNRPLSCSREEWAQTDH